MFIASTPVQCFCTNLGLGNFKKLVEFEIAICFIIILTILKTKKRALFIYLLTLNGF